MLYFLIVLWPSANRSAYLSSFYVIGMWHFSVTRDILGHTTWWIPLTREKCYSQKWFEQRQSLSAARPSMFEMQWPTRCAMRFVVLFDATLIGEFHLTFCSGVSNCCSMDICFGNNHFSRGWAKITPAAVWPCFATHKIWRIYCYVELCILICRYVESNMFEILLCPCGCVRSSSMSKSVTLTSSCAELCMFDMLRWRRIDMWCLVMSSCVSWTNCYVERHRFDITLCRIMYFRWTIITKCRLLISCYTGLCASDILLWEVIVFDLLLCRRFLIHSVLESKAP